MLANASDVYWQSIREGLTPAPRMTVSEWADANRFLGTRSAAEAGRWRTSRTPYLREIMDSLSPSSPVETTVMMAGAQIGKTETGNNWLGFTIDQDPCPILIVLPTVDLGKRHSRQKLEPMIDDCPTLRAKVRDPRSRDSGNTVLQKEFPGGILLIAGANSAAALRAMAARKVMLDEVDAYPGDVEGEGDPIELARARTRTFTTNRKFFITSTPTFADRSRIEREFKKGDQRYYHVPCPHCSTLQKLLWSNLIWEKGKPETVRYRCAPCEQLIEERHKETMLPRGVWIAENPSAPRNFRSYHLNSLYSPLGWYSWRQAAQQWEEAQGRPDLLRNFVQTVLGETYREAGEAPDWKALYERREELAFGRVPERGLVLTAGVDVQARRLEVEVVAWGRGMESWSVEYDVFPGDTSEPEVWKNLDSMLERTFPHEGGSNLPIRMMAVDSGYATNTVYAWARHKPLERVMVVKGVGRQMTALANVKQVDVDWQGKRARRGVQIWPIGVSVLKSELYGWLRMRKPVDAKEPLPPGWCHFPMYGPEYFEQLTAEQLVTHVRKGYRFTDWENVRPGGRNEALDCRVYARAAAEVLALPRWPHARFERVERALGVASPPSPTQDPRHASPGTGPRRPRRPSGGGFLSRWRD